MRGGHWALGRPREQGQSDPSGHSAPGHLSAQSPDTEPGKTLARSPGRVPENTASVGLFAAHNHCRAKLFRRLDVYANVVLYSEHWTFMFHKCMHTYLWFLIFLSWDLFSLWLGHQEIAVCTQLAIVKELLNKLLVCLFLSFICVTYFLLYFWITWSRKSELKVLFNKERQDQITFPLIKRKIKSQQISMKVPCGIMVKIALTRNWPRCLGSLRKNKNPDHEWLEFCFQFWGSSAWGGTKQPEKILTVKISPKYIETFHTDLLLVLGIRKSLSPGPLGAALLRVLTWDLMCTEGRVKSQTLHTFSRWGKRRWSSKCLW